MMKRLFTYLTLALVAVTASAQEAASPLDSVDLGNLFRIRAGSNPVAGSAKWISPTPCTGSSPASW